MQAAPSKSKWLAASLNVLVGMHMIHRMPPSWSEPECFSAVGTLTPAAQLTANRSGWGRRKKDPVSRRSRARSRRCIAACSVLADDADVYRRQTAQTLSRVQTDGRRKLNLRSTSIEAQRGRAAASSGYAVRRRLLPLAAVAVAGLDVRSINHSSQQQQQQLGTLSDVTKPVDR